MTRGKYAARAANREARLDNELIAEKVNQVAVLKAEIGRLETTLADERRDRSAEVVRRADELSAEEIRLVKDSAAQAAARHEQICRDTALWIAEYLHNLSVRFPDEKFLPMPGSVDDYEPVLRRLVGQSVGEYMRIAFGGVEARFSNREHRRATLDSYAWYREASGLNNFDRKKDLVEGLRKKTDERSVQEA